MPYIFVLCMLCVLVKRVFCVVYVSLIHLQVWMRKLYICE